MDYIKLSECAYYRNERTDIIDFDTYITTDNMLPNRGGIKRAETLPEAKTVSKYLPGDILLSNIRPYFRKIWFSNREGGCSNDVLVVAAKQNIYPEFLYYVLSDDNFFNYDNVTSKGTKMPRGTPNAIMKYLVPNFDQNKQKKIASMLSAYDDIIDRNIRQISVLEQMIVNLYKEWFVRFRYPGNEESSHSGGVPDGWNMIRVKELTKRLPFGKLYKAEDAEKDGNVIIIDQSTDEFVGFHSGEPSHYASVENPVALFGDHSCKSQLMITPFSLSENVIPYIANEGIELVYLFYSIHGLVETTEYKRHWSELMAKRIMVAPYELQQSFSKIVKPIINAIKKIKQQNRVLLKQKDIKR